MNNYEASFDNGRKIIYPEQIEAIRNASDSMDSERVREFLDKGIANNPDEARDFVLDLRKAIETSEAAREMLGGFRSVFDKIVAEAEEHLAGLEEGMEGPYEDRAAVFRDIAKGLALNIDENVLREERGPYKPNVARRFANFIGRHKAAFIAVNVFVAALRIGGGAIQSAEDAPFDGGVHTDGHLSYDELALSAEIHELGDMSDFEYVDNLLQGSGIHSG